MVRYSLAGLVPRNPLMRPRLLLGLIDASVAGDDAAALRYALVRGRQVSEQGRCQADDLRRVPAAEMAIAFASRTSFFEHTRLKVPAGKTRMQMLQARRFVDGEMVFNEPFRLRLQQTGHSEGGSNVEIAAAAEGALGDVERACPRDHIPVTQLALAEIAIAALVREAAPGPALVFWSRGNFALALLVEDGYIRSRQMDVMHGREGQTALGEWLDFIGRSGDALRHAARQKMPNQDVYLRLYLGDLHDTLGPELRSETRAAGCVEQDRASAALEEKLAGLLRFDGAEGGAGLLRAPELYGLLFTDPVWNWLPDDYQDRVHFHRWARPAAALAGAAALGLLGYDLSLLPKTSAVDGDTQQRALALAKDIRELKARIPSAEEATLVEKQIGLAARSELEIRLDRFLPWMTRSVASGVAIRQLSVSALAPAGSATRDRGTAPPAAGAAAAEGYPPQGERGYYEVMVELEAHGSYEETQHALATTLRQLALRLHIAYSTFRYGPRSNDEGGEALGSLTARLIAKGKDFH